ncbi:MAG: AsmA family protein [Planctomycetota bacterium]
MRRRRARRRTWARRRKRRLRGLFFLLVLPLLLLLLLYVNGRLLLNPEQISARARQILDERLAVPFQLDAISFGFLSGLTVHGLEIGAPAGCRFERLLVIPQAHVNFSLFDLLIGRVRLTEIEINKPQLYLERDDEGAITLARMLRGGPAEPSAARPDGTGHLRLRGEIPALKVKDLEVHTCPESVFNMEKPFIITSLTLDFSAEDRHAYTVEGSAFYPSFQSIRILGSGNAATGDFQGRAELLRLELDDDLRRRLPHHVSRVWDEYRPRGIANLAYDITLSEGRRETTLATIQVIDGSLSLSNPPLTLQSISGTVEVSPERIRTTEPLRGMAGRGDAQLEGSIDLAEGEIERSKLDLLIEEVPLGKETRALFTGKLLEQWDKLSPRGLVKLELHAGGPSFPPPLIESKVTLKGVTVVYEKLPYPLRGLEGTVDIGNDRIDIDVRGGSPDTPVTVNGYLSTKPNLPLDLHVHVDNLLLNEEVELALPPNHRRIWRRYRPGGRADIDLYRTKEAEGPEKAKTVVVITGRGAAIRYEGFDYLIEGITGEVQFRPGQVVLSDLEGRHGDSRVFLDAGAIDSLGDGRFAIDLPIRSPALEIDADLIAALPEESAHTVRSFGIQGRIGTTVWIITEDDGRTNVKVEASIVPPCLCRHEQFPYPILFRQGFATFNKTENFISFERFESDPARGPLIRMNGVHEVDRENPAKRLLSVRAEVVRKEDGSGLPIEEPTLVASLPGDLGTLFERLQLSGDIAGSITVDYRYVAGEEGAARREEVDYSGAADSRSASVDFGMVFSEINTNVTFTGHFDPETPHNFTVDLEGGDLRFSRFHIEDPQVFFSYGAQHPLVLLASRKEAEKQEMQRREGRRRPAPRRPEEGPSPYLPGEPFLTRLGPNQVEGTLQARVRSARLYGGLIEGFLYVDAGARKDFCGEMRCANVDLAQGGADLFKTQQVAGIARGNVLFSGATDLPRQMQGHGEMHIRQGRLVKLPLVAALFLNPFKGVEKKNLYIKKVDVKFTIDKDRFVVKRFEDMILKSPVVNILAKGWMDFNQDLELTIEPQVGKIPLISGILSSLTTFTLEGPLENPTTRKPSPPPK